MAPLEIGAVLLQACLFLIAGRAVGGWMLRAFTDEDPLGAPEVMLVTILGGVAWAVSLMTLHIVTGGAVFGYPPVVPVLTLVLVATWHLRGGGGSRPWKVPGGWSAWATVAAVFVLVFLYVLPMVTAGSAVRTGDSPWHLGWTEQILAGERVPTGPAPEFGRNAYPWGFHAVISMLVRLVPGTSPLLALGAVHLVLVLGLPLAGASLARRIAPRAGWWGAAATSLIGGFGWLFSGGPEFSTSPGVGTAGADLVVASPNSVYELLPPPLPRELGLVLLGAVGVMLAIGGSSRAKRTAVGVAIGLVGLVSVPMFLSAIVWATASLITSREDRRAAAIQMALPAVAVFGWWFGPVVADYIRFGGFVDITPRLGKEWTLFHGLTAWGFLVPLAAVGFWWERTAGASARRVTAFVVASSALLFLAYARGIFDWSLAGNATILHQGRIWPPLHLLAGAGAGAGAVWLIGRASGNARRASFVLVTVFALGAMSPIFASVALTGTMREGRSGFVYNSPEIAAPDSFVQTAAAELGPDDVVHVEGSDELAFLLWQFSGARLARYDHPNLERNDLRIRFADRAESWQRAVDGGGFEPDYSVVPLETTGPSLPSGLASGIFQGTRWVLVPAAAG